MDALFEVRYLDVTWYDETTVVSVTPALMPLELEFDVALRRYMCDTVVYPRAPGVNHGQLAFRFLGVSQGEPYLRNAVLEKLPLQRVVDPRNGTVWWTEGFLWMPSRRRWVGRAHRTAGHLTVDMDGQVCQVNIGVSESSDDDLDNYLADFKADLWELILDPGSYVTAQARTTVVGVVSAETIRAIGNIISCVKNIVDSPKSELREIQALRPRQYVRPVMRTFMELSAKSNARSLTSRATIASYNVPENRYVLFALERVLQMVRQMMRVAQSRITQLTSKSGVLRERLENFRQYIQIDEALVRRDMDALSRSCDIGRLNERLEATSRGLLVEGKTPDRWRFLCLKLIDKNESGSYFAGVKAQVEDDWFERMPGHQSVFVAFGNPNFHDIFEKGLEYSVVAVLTEANGTSAKGEAWYRYTLEKLRKVEVTGGAKVEKSRQALLSYQKKTRALEEGGWSRRLNANELAEQARERNSVLTQLNQVNEIKQNAEVALSHLVPKYGVIKTLVETLRRLSVKPLGVFPNSMTFVQNPDYQGVHAGYKSLLNLTGLLDEDLLLVMEEVDQMGMVNIPMLYERWCLVQIVKVFVQEFHFIPPEGYKKSLLNMVASRGGNDFLQLEHPHLRRRVRLMYEPILDNGKTPDFVLDITADSDEDSITRRFVLDAKYYTRDLIDRFGGISSVIRNLYSDKDYSENEKNFVFVIHPAQHALPERVSPQPWGVHSYLGELRMFDWDGPARVDRFHQYGAVSATPARGGRYLDEFQRLVGMFLQYGIEDNKLDRNATDNVQYSNLCIACGSHEVKHIEKSNGNSRSAWYECLKCLHFTVYNHCHNCNTRLVKNGGYWTYHSHVPIEPLNIKCPACETLA